MCKITKRVGDMGIEEVRRVGAEERSNMGRGGDEGCPKNHNQTKAGEGEGNLSSQSSSSANKGKSCKGCLYYSSALKSDSSNPLCVGITRSLPQVPRYIVGESEMEASREGRTLADFRYACVGYSVYSDRKGQSTDVQEVQTELPVCVGIEVLVDRGVATADSAPASFHNREDVHGSPPRQSPKPAHSVGEEFLNRFARNAGLVATGVAKNLRKVGNRIKENVDDILYPYRRRPK